MRSKSLELSTYFDVTNRMYMFPAVLFSLGTWRQPLQGLCFSVLTASYTVWGWDGMGWDGSSAVYVDVHVSPASVPTCALYWWKHTAHRGLPPRVGVPKDCKKIYLIFCNVSTTTARPGPPWLLGWGRYHSLAQTCRKNHTGVLSVC